jgi:putative MATE family efflux protein
MINDLTTGSVSRQLLAFAAPFLLSNVLQTMYSIIDMVIVGQFVGSEGLSGVSIGTDILFLIQSICIGFASAGQIIISQYVGAKDSDAVRKTIGTMFTVIMLGGLFFTILGITTINPVLRAMNTPPEAYTQAYNFTIVCYCGMVFIFGYNTVSAVLRGMGDSKRPFYFILTALIITVALDLLFVAVLGMEAWGAALATVIGQCVSFISSIIYLYRHREAFGFDFRLKSFAVDRLRFGLLIRLGAPMALQFCAISLSMLFVNSWINSFGLISSAVTGIGNKLRTVMAIMSNSIGAAGSAMIGQNLGAGKLDRVSRIVRISLFIAVTYAIVFSAVIIIFPEQIFRLFSKEPEVLAMAGKFMPSLAVCYITFGLMCPFNALINGLGFASLGLVSGILDGVVARIGLSLLLGLTFSWGVAGFWYGNAYAGFVTVMIGGIYYFSGRWKKRKLIIQGN